MNCGHLAANAHEIALADQKIRQRALLAQYAEANA